MLFLRGAGFLSPGEYFLFAGEVIIVIQRGPEALCRRYGRKNGRGEGNGQHSSTRKAFHLYRRRLPRAGRCLCLRRPSPYFKLSCFSREWRHLAAFVIILLVGGISESPAPGACLKGPAGCLRVQHILGNCAPVSISSTRLAPITVFRATFLGCAPTTWPTIPAS